MERDPQWTLIRDLFLGAAARHGEERSRYLEAHCSSSEIRQEVENLLEASERTAVMDMDGGPTLTESAFAPPLTPGAKLGHYQIRRKLGSGGMGWVYEAQDEFLRRTVAIKVLPPGGINDEQRRRFTREAQSASALNHPNIITVHEVGRDQGIDFIVMERIEGDTLRQKIGAKGLDPRTALRYAAQMADAIAAAHDAGIVHRDLKPGNVMVTERGLVKVLDFGLAKQAPKRRAASGMDGATMDSPLSEMGQVVGTLSYMSPEQAEGKPVDGRSDIFSFGSVFFEMLTGHRAFEHSGIGTLEAIVHKEPPLQDLPASLPRGIGRILAKCLAKKPADRWQHISDVRLQIEDLIKDLDSPAVEETQGHTKSVWVTGAAALTGALVAAGIFWWVAGRSNTVAPEPILRMITADNGLNTSPALSHDGKLLVFASDRSKEGNLDIWLQQVGGRDPVRLTSDPADESSPDFSPDGTRVAFRSEKEGGGIYVVSSLGGDVPTLIAPEGRGPRFSPDGKWIAFWKGREGTLIPGSSQLFIVESGGGPPRAIHPEISAAVFPVWSPNGSQLLARARVSNEIDWYVIPLETGQPLAKTGALSALRAQGLLATQAGLAVRLAPIDWIAGRRGHRLLFPGPLGDVANLWEIDLDPEKYTVRGSPRRLSRGPGRQVLASHSLTETSERIAFANEDLNYDVWSLSVDAESGVTRGNPVQLTDEHSPEWAPSISWDGTKLAYISRRGGTWFLRTRDMESGKDNAVISSPVHIYNGRLTGDGNRLLYSTVEFGLYSTPRMGGSVEKLCDKCGTLMGVSSDGGKALFEPLTDEDLLVFDREARGSYKLALRQDKGALLSGGRFSPDEKWIAFHSIHSPGGTTQVWIMPVDGRKVIPASEWIPVTDGKSRERDPCWSPRGGLMYYLSERDGFRCIWARKIDPKTKRPVADAFPVRHFHFARQSLQPLSNLGYLAGLTVGGDKLVFSVAELTGNIWLAESASPK